MSGGSLKWKEKENERKNEKKANKRKEDEEETEGKDKDGEEVLEGAEEERKIPRVTVTRLCTPLPSKNRHEVLKAIIDMYLRLRSDGFTVNQIHSDRGGEFCSDALEKWCTSRTILHTCTPGISPNQMAAVRCRCSGRRQGLEEFDMHPNRTSLFGPSLQETSTSVSG